MKWSEPSISEAQPQLGSALQYATTECHRQVERSAFVSRLLAGKLDGGSYLRWLVSLESVYESLEAGLKAHAAHPLLAPTALPGLARAAALQQDVAHWAGYLQRECPGPVPSARRYGEHLLELTQQRPELLLAHGYVRYLGDLSGGQLLLRAVRRMLPDREPQGAAFYDFGGADTVRRLASEYRAGLAAAGPVARAHGCFEAVVDEAVAAFGRHAQMFAELGESL